MEPPLNPDLVVQSLNFHGQQLQKLWESERGEDDLSKVNVNSKEIDFEVYQQRQKQLSFQDRGKRLKLQQFIVKKATSLFELSLSEASETVKDKTQNDDDCYAVMPPYEAFIDLDKQSRLMHFLENLQRGDVVFCSIVSKSVSGLMLKVLCSDGEQQRYVSDINVKAFCPMSSMIPAADKKSVTRNYLVNDTVCCEVLEVMPDTEKLVVGMKGFALPPDSEYSCRLGLITSEDFPEMYKKTQDMKGESYQKVLEKTLGFYNPNNINYLANLLGLGSTNYSHMTGMRGRFPEQEYASELRQIQASKWAFRSVAEGIEHFKSGRHSEAFQCLNKALNIDPRNVEGLVARGALYANSGSFQKAIEDFETALKLNPNHQNARKYAGETLVALGRSYEDENKFDEALKAYQNCLSLIPFHEEAQNSIEYLKNKILNSSKLSDSEVTIPGLNSSKSAEVKETLKQLLKSNEEEEKKEKEKSKSKKKKERKSRKRRHRSSSSSSTSSSASSRSSSSSSSSSSDSSSASSRSGSHSRSRSPSRSRKSSKKHRKSSKKKEDKREKSLSPLSKRMALMDPNSEVEGLGGLLAQRVSHYNPPAVPFSFTPFQVVQDTSMQKSYEKDDYEQRVCRFLEQTKGDSEYEEKVRKFLEESARWKKERKAQEEKSKKKKKKEKKSRDKEKNKKKKREREEHEKKKKHRSKRSDKFDIKDFEEQMESKKFRDAIRKELTVKDETRKRKSIDDEEEFLYGSGSDKKDLRLLGLENLPDLEDLESKLSAYYAKVEKDTGLSKRSEEKGEKEKKRHSSSPGKNKHASPKVVFVHNEEAKVEETLRAREKKKMDMFADSPSPPANSKEKATPESATVMPSKWKIQIGSTNTRIKKKDKSQIEKEPWDEIEEKRFIFLKDNDKEGSEDEAEVRKKKQPEEKFSARKSRETAEKIVQEKPKKESSEEAREDSITKTQQFMDKFQSGFRINSSRSSEKKSDELPPLPPGMPPKTSFTISGRGKTTPVLANSSSQAKGPRTDSDTDSNASEKRKKKKPPQQQPQQQQPTPTSQQTPTAASSSAGPGRRLSSGESSRSRSRSRTKYSRASSSNSSRSRSRSYPKNRNRSKSASYDGRRSRSASYARYGSRSRSRSYYRSSASRSRSRSYRSRSRSYDRYSRSRSRSEDYRRRSRSESDDRRRRHDYHMNKFQGRYPRNRGTYYRPRFQSNYKNARGGSNFANRGNRNFHQKYGPGRGNRPFNNRGRGRGRPRFFHYKPSSGYRDYHSRRYEGRPRSRSSDGRRSYSREDDDPMKKVDAAKEKINKYIAEENKKDDAQAASSKSRDEPLSEGEAVDDDDYGLPPLPPGGPPSRESSYVDRKSYEGKWAEKDSEEKSSRNRGSEGPRLPPENSIEEMDKFLNKVKGQKKDDSKERSKSFGKSSSNW